MAKSSTGGPDTPQTAAEIAVAHAKSDPIKDPQPVPMVYEVRTGALGPHPRGTRLTAEQVGDDLHRLVANHTLVPVAADTPPVPIGDGALGTPTEPSTLPTPALDLDADFYRVQHDLVGPYSKGALVPADQLPDKERLLRTGAIVAHRNDPAADAAIAYAEEQRAVEAKTKGKAESRTVATDAVSPTASVGSALTGPAAPAPTDTTLADVLGTESKTSGERGADAANSAALERGRADAKAVGSSVPSAEGPKS